MDITIHTGSRAPDSDADHCGRRRTPMYGLSSVGGVLRTFTDALLSHWLTAGVRLRRPKAGTAGRPSKGATNIVPA